ncbi:hypothetical protein CQA40_09570 [Helicobacter sp. MIT 01-3238]|nr:hypothetical protein CQA40_09570 [Helicobacter sp. MIT 01-3238]
MSASNYIIKRVWWHFTKHIFAKFSTKLATKPATKFLAKTLLAHRLFYAQITQEILAKSASKRDYQILIKC